MKNLLALSFLLLALSFLGCGYKPTTTYTTPLVGKKIYTEVKIDVKNPIDSIFLKDALNESIIAVFNAKIDTDNWDSKFLLKVNYISISPIDYDKNGYPILYSSKTYITAYITDKMGNFNSYSAQGSYDFSIDNNAVLSDDLKHKAIKEAFLKALQMIEFKLAQKGIKMEKSDDNQSN